jgi:hypothetical protein
VHTCQCGNSSRKEIAAMVSANVLPEYLAELRQQVCRRCLVRRRGCPPCHPSGVECGIELHLPRLVELCRKTHSVRLDPYQDALRQQICAECPLKDRPACPCPLQYLLPLAVEAVETVDQRRRSAAAARAFADAGADV